MDEEPSAKIGLARAAKSGACHCRARVLNTADTLHAA